MADSFGKLKDINLSGNDERLHAALKKPEFRRLLRDYVYELHDPKSKQLYQEEITLLEKQKGIDVTFIDPKPGYVLKLSVNGNQKAFINICCNEHISKPSSSPCIREGSKKLGWSLPYSFSSPHDEYDKKGVLCQVFDVIFNPDTLHLASNNKAFRVMLNDTALEAVESNFDVTLNKTSLRFPRLKYKGVPHASVIRKPSANRPEDTPEYLTPKYRIKHRILVDIQEFTENKNPKFSAAIPKELVVEINLPLLKSSADITFEVTEKTVQLISETPARYKLNLTLPYSVNESYSLTKFDEDRKMFFITLKVKSNAVTKLASSDCNNSTTEKEYISSGICETEENPVKNVSE